MSYQYRKSIADMIYQVERLFMIARFFFNPNYSSHICFVTRRIGNNESQKHKETFLSFTQGVYFHWINHSVDLNKSKTVRIQTILRLNWNILRLSSNQLFCMILWMLISESWWGHQMQTFSALLAIYEGNSPVLGEFPAQRPVTRSFDAFFDPRPNKRLSKQSWGWWFETPSRLLWRHCNDPDAENCTRD